MTTAAGTAMNKTHNSNIRKLDNCFSCRGRKMARARGRLPRSCHLFHRMRMLAGRRRIHVGEGAARIGLPGPHMQLVERRQTVTIGRAVEVEELALQLGRALG